MKLNPLIHQEVRLRIMAALASLGEGDVVDFSYLKKTLGLTDGNLGAHLTKLERAEYITLHKHFVGRKPRTDLSLTPKGRGAFEMHVVALREIIDS